MARKVIGETGSRRRRWLFLLCLVLTITTAVVFISGAVAVNNTGAFELDGNAVTSHSGTGAPDDFDRVCYQVAKDDGATNTDATAKCFGGGDTATPTGTNGATATAWTDASDNPEIFTGGGSKDHSDPQNSWLWKPADTVPDKDTILHAFASRYSLAKDAATCPAPATSTTCDVIFFGSDRFANDGDSQLGFWFTQNKVSTTNTPSNGGFTFNGHHTNGDLLVISDFSNGGTTSTIRAYFWDTTCGSDHTAANKIFSSPGPGQCADSNLRLKAQSSNANCATSASTANFCGIVNGANGATAPWSFLDKTGHSTFSQGEFYEAGVNLSGLGIGTECFSSVIAESRASDSVGSVLKDLVAQNFGDCTSGTSTTPQADTGGGSGYENVGEDPGVSIGTAARLHVRDHATLTVTNATSFGGTIDYYLCGPLALASTGNCATGGVKVSTVNVSGGGEYFSNDSAKGGSDTVLTSVGRYCWRAVYSGDSSKGVPGSSDPTGSTDTSTTECFKVNPVQPDLTTAAGDDVVLGNDITDTATLSGTAMTPGTDGVGTGGTINATAATQDNAGGSITWSVDGPGGCTASGLTVSGSPATVSGDDDYLASATPTAIGEYTFIASYDGSSPNTLGAGPSACPNSDEAVSVTGTAGLSTAQDWLPNDTATLTGDANLNGTLTFTLYDDGTCGQDGGSPVYSPDPITVTDAVSGSTFTTSNTAFKIDVSSDGNYSWLVSYQDDNLQSPSDTCESTAITVTDG
jgi:hypothetical protein